MILNVSGCLRCVYFVHCWSVPIRHPSSEPRSIGRRPGPTARSHGMSRRSAMWLQVQREMGRRDKCSVDVLGLATSADVLEDCWSADNYNPLIYWYTLESDKLEYTSKLYIYILRFFSLSTLDALNRMPSSFIFLSLILLEHVALNSDEQRVGDVFGREISQSRSSLKGCLEGLILAKVSGSSTVEKCRGQLKMLK